MDYRFAIMCYQDQAGDENAKANVFFDDTQVATEVEITSTDANSGQLITWETTGLSEPNSDGSVNFSVRVELVNDYYVDTDTDRNIIIYSLGYVNKDSDNNYKVTTYDGDTPTTSVITDFTAAGNYTVAVPTAVTGDQIPSNFWDRDGNTDSFYDIPVLGGDNGVTMTIPALQKTFSP